MDLQQALAALTDADRQVAKLRASTHEKIDASLDLLNPTVQSPYPLGQSPHKVKGGVFPGTFGFANRVLPDGAKRLRAKLANPFFEQRFDAKGWYDAYALFVLQRALAAELSLPFDLLLLIMARQQVQADLSGALRFVLKVVSAKTIASTLTLMGSSWWDFMKYKTRLVAPQRLEVRAEGVPLVLRNALVVSGGEYNAHALRVSGTASTQLEVGAFEFTGPANARTVGTGTYYLKW